MCTAAELAARFNMNKYVHEIQHNVEAQDVKTIVKKIENQIKNERKNNLEHQLDKAKSTTNIKDQLDLQVKLNLLDVDSFRPHIHILHQQTETYHLNEYIDQIYLFFDTKFNLIDNQIDKHYQPEKAIYLPCKDDSTSIDVDSSSTVCKDNPHKGSQ